MKDLPAVIASYTNDPRTVAAIMLTMAFHITMSEPEWWKAMATDWVRESDAANKIIIQGLLPVVIKEYKPGT